MSLKPLAAILGLALFTPPALADGARFRVRLDPAPGLAPEQPVSGRLIISVIRPGPPERSSVDPLDAPIWGNPQPLFGIDVSGLTPEKPIDVGDEADANFEKPGALPPGEYRAAARLITSRQSSAWRGEAGNLFSAPVQFTIPADGPVTVDLTLSRITSRREWPSGEFTGGAELFQIRSTLLSDFHKRDVVLRAGVVKPTAFDPARKYAAVYEVPGFGGDHFGAIPIARRRNPSSSRAAMGAEGLLQSEVFWIVLDPESPNGHTLFADSDNNGPRARALVEELIPALESKYPLAPKPEARLLRGHSSGGWSTLWLALTHPETFGATWSTAPDPVDFRRMQLVDIYKQANFYKAQPPASPPINPDPAAWPDTPSFRSSGRTLMTIRDEARAEDILGPDNTSGQQWDSWFAVFGPRSQRGNPAALFDPLSGRIDPAVASHYRKYDIGHLVRTEPDRLIPLFPGRVHLVVGDADNFYLNEAVSLLKTDITASSHADAARAAGTITIVRGRDHQSLMGSPEVRDFPVQMLNHLRKHGLENR